MNHGNHFVSVPVFALLVAACASLPTGGNEEQTPSPKASIEEAEDRAVLGAFLQHILTLPPEEASLLPKSGFQIILHERTPERTGMIQSPQWKTYDTQGDVPDEMHQALLDRNVEAPPYEARNVSYRTMDFAPPILLADVRAAQSSRYDEFEKKFPEARAWVEAFLPGYSPDKTHALVAAWVGPTPHGAFALAALDKKEERWRISWYSIYWFV